MPGSATLEQVELTELGTGRKGPDNLPPDGGEGDGAPGAKPAVPKQAYFTGLLLGLAAILMFFLAFASAFIVRRGLGNDWRAVELPPLLWINTVVLLISSVTLERARQLLRQRSAGFRGWWSLTTLLGGGFLVGQVVVWTQLAAQGVFLATNPASSFFYVLTAAHGVHLAGGVCALLYVGARSLEHLQRTGGLAAGLAGMYWHFMDGLWVALFLLLYFGR